MAIDEGFCFLASCNISSYVLNSSLISSLEERSFVPALQSWFQKKSTKSYVACRSTVVCGS